MVIDAAAEVVGDGSGDCVDASAVVAVWLG